MADNPQKKRILVVDDEPDESSYLSTLLEDNGYITATANNGNHAMKQIQDQKPDLVTLDMTMPEKSGVKLFREMRETPELAEIPILVITGVTGFGGRSEDFEKFLASRKNVRPPDGFIAKPVDREQLLRRIAELLS